jgi:hypothetical protein
MEYLVESRVAVLEAQLAESRTRDAEAELTSGKAAGLCNELRKQNFLLLHYRFDVT